MARPREIDREALLANLEKYIEETEIPIFAEFAYKNNINRQQLYEYPELTDAIKRCHDKKEASLERHALDGTVGTSMAIFSLKQLGWSDKQETTLQGGDKPITVKIEYV